MNSRAKYLVVISSTLLVLLLLLGTVLGKGTSTSEGPYRQLSVYTEVLSRIKSEYVEEPDMKSVTLGALNGLLESIDPFASYLNADQYKEYQKHDEAKGDVGLILSKRFGYIGVVSAFPGSPAAKAGLSTGDIIETIKGVGTRDMPLAYATLLLRGAPGSTIDITVLRHRPEPQKMTLTRAALNPPPVVSKTMPNEVGYIRPEILSGDRVQQIAADLRDLEGKGVKKLILDLRQCAVGDPADGVALADLFLDKGLVTYLQGQRLSRQDFKADASKVVWKLPVVVLTNRGTADGAEIATAALEDNNRAQVVGERTYGDASLLRALTMDDGSAIILSVAKYYSPSGKAIQDTGVTPNEAVQEPEPQLEADEDNDNARPDAAEAEQKTGDDPILKRGVEVLAK